MARNAVYRQAEEKIAEAQRSGATELDLSQEWDAKDSDQLTELPASLWELTQLQSLDLSYNQLTVLPEAIGQLTQLQSLDLSYNQLTALPEAIGQLTQLQSLHLSHNQLTALPEAIGQLTQLQSLDLSSNRLTALPESIGKLTQLSELILWVNNFRAMPEVLRCLKQLKILHFGTNQLQELPNWIGDLKSLEQLVLFANNLSDLPVSLSQLVQLQSLSIAINYFTLLPKCIFKLRELKHLYASINSIKTLTEDIGNLKKLETFVLGGEIVWARIHAVPEYQQRNQLIDLPLSLSQLEHLEELNLSDNPLNPELAAAYEQGLDAVKAYLRAKTEEQIVLNEAKLILVGEGEVGKTCLMDALADEAWQKHESTHGIQIRPVVVTDAESDRVITLNGWDFGGQRVYRPTHQLFFSSPAVYLVVWKPREGPQQGLVKEWIKLVTHREPEAKILVVATHGGPGGRQPDIDRQELWDLFGRETVLDFFHVESKPNRAGRRRGINELKQRIAHIAASLPEMGRSVPKSFQAARQALIDTDEAYLPLKRVYGICHEQGLEPYIAQVFVAISHRLGHLIHYENDPILRDIVVLKPDWLATAISFVLDDEVTRAKNGLVPFSRLQQIWNAPGRAPQFRYPPALHTIFLRLMERFDLSYRVAGLAVGNEDEPVSLIAQLVPDTRPQDRLEEEWLEAVSPGDAQQMQICRIVDVQSGQSATAEGLFYQLIVRLHHLSLGRNHFDDSVHWQRGLVLDNDYNGRALLIHHGNDVHITVRAAYPQGLLSRLTAEVKYLVESFWEGLRCDVMVRCLNPKECAGLFEVSRLIENKRRGHPAQPCPVCNDWQEIDRLLTNAPAATSAPVRELVDSPAFIREIRQLGTLIAKQHDESIGRFDRLDAGQKELLSKADAAYEDLMRALTDEAKEGPRLFTLMPVNRSRFNPRRWVNTKFRLTLWCEHSRRPLPILNGLESKKGVYEIELSREWFKRAAPYLKVLNVTLSLVLPVAKAGYALTVDDAALKAIEEQLDFGTEVIDASLSGSKDVGNWLEVPDGSFPEHGHSSNDPIRAHGPILRELHAMLKAKDPGFGGLVRVQNKRREFLWVHERFVSEY